MSTGSTQSKIAILIVAYNGFADLAECLASLEQDADDAGCRQIFVVDNASTDGTPDRLARDFPGVRLIRSQVNLRFARGNNLGWQQIAAEAPQIETLVLLNQDTIVSPGWLVPLAACLRQNPQVAAVQPKILLCEPAESGDAPRINTVGNRSHYLGFGYMTGYGEVDRGQYDSANAMAFPSGAAVALNAAAIRSVGLFDPEYGSYGEDQELGWRLRLGGWECRSAPQSVVRHKYVPTAPWKHYASLERNRWRTLLTCYRWRTLAVLFPILVLMECGQALFALRRGLFRERLRAWGAICRPSFWHGVLLRRQFVQSLRRISDRELISTFSPTIQFAPLDSRLLELVGNPLLKTYWGLVRRVICW